MSAMSIARRAASATLFATSCLSAAASAAPQFVALGDLGGGAVHSEATAVSNGGAVVVGTATTAAGRTAFRWTGAQGLQTLGPLGDGVTESTANSVSDDGDVVTGDRFGQGGVQYSGFVWSATAPLEILPTYPDAFGGANHDLIQPVVSPDGSLVAGVSREGAGNSFFFVFDRSSQPVSYGGVDIGSVGSVSDAGVVVATGNRSGAVTGVYLPAGAIPFNHYDDRPSALLDGALYGTFRASADSAIVVGPAMDLDDPVIWIGGGEPQALSALPGHTSDISADASVVVGTVLPEGSQGSHEAVLWTAGAGMRTVASVLRDDYGIATAFAGWTNTVATAISSDGTAIAGYGTNPAGDTEAWLAIIPEPGTGLLLGLGLSGLAASVRKRAARGQGRRRGGSRALGIAAILATVLAARPSHGAGASFTRLGFLPGATESRAEAVSADGSAVAGRTGIGSLQEAFRWTAATGLVDLGRLPVRGSGDPGGISGDGFVVVGAAGGQAFRWTVAEGAESLGDLPGHYSSDARDASADGSVVVGVTGAFDIGLELPEAFRWTPDTGMVGLGRLDPPGDGESLADGVSEDGSIVVGAANAFDWFAFRWTQQTGMVPLAPLPGHSSCAASDVSPDGVVIVGWCEKGSEGLGTYRLVAFRWTEQAGTIELGLAPAHAFSRASAVSRFGSVIVGWSGTSAVKWSDAQATDAVIWDGAHGMRRLQEVLAAEGVNLDGWTLRSATDVSADGLTIVGWGTNPEGQIEGWVATLPPQAPRCGLGFEVAPFLVALRWRRRRGSILNA